VLDNVPQAGSHICVEIRAAIACLTWAESGSGLLQTHKEVLQSLLLTLLLGVYCSHPQNSTDTAWHNLTANCLWCHGVLTNVPLASSTCYIFFLSFLFVFTLFFFYCYGAALHSLSPANLPASQKPETTHILGEASTQQLILMNSLLEILGCKWLCQYI
jgi:hypothetical protein